MLVMVVGDSKFFKYLCTNDRLIMLTLGKQVW